MTFRLTRFSGSTLEPCSEPIVLYPSEVQPKKPMVLKRFSGSTLAPPSPTEPSSLYRTAPAAAPAAAPKPSIDFSSMAALSVRIIPTRPTKPLKRQAKPSSIHIPNLGQIASMNAADRLLDEGHASGGSDDEANEPWLMWDEKTQTIYRPEKRHAFWDTPPPRPASYFAYSPTPSFSSASSTSSTD
ncbi:hypothetical protein CLU79DRAFT_891951 [Phycomyces nitens]|nr:hypothetical protein CLU79DRAFT_891951 [Phycomyces nitens]